MKRSRPPVRRPDDTARRKSAADRRAPRYAPGVKPALSMLRVAVPVWTVFGLACSASVTWAMRDHGHSPARIAGYEVLVWWGWAAATPLVAWLGGRVPLVPFSARATLLHVGAALVLGLAHQVWWKLLTVAIRPFDAMGPQRLGDVSWDVLDDLFLEVAAYFAILGVTYAIDYHRRLRDREASLVRARLTALELQLRPHFLFNTLHAIGGLVRQGRGAEAIAMITGLSDLLRYSLDHAGKPLVALEQEAAITARYLEIQRQRFSDRLTTTIEIAPELARARVPALLLQPLVENAVRHGIERSSGPGAITVRARRRDAELVIEVANTGPPLAGREPGVGVENTRARLAGLFGARQALELRDDAAGVVAIVTLPYQEVRT